MLVTDDVRLNGQRINPESKTYLVMNKPKGYVTTMKDKHAERTVMDLIAGQCTKRVFPVGRLDKDTTGVLLFTNDGDLTEKLIHPSYNKRKSTRFNWIKTSKNLIWRNCGKVFG